MNIQFRKGFTIADFPQAKELWLNKGDIFLYEGDGHRQKCYFIVSGQLDVRLISGSGHETLLYNLKEGDLVGELAMFGVEARTATIVASMRTCLLEVNSHEFKAKIKEYDFLERVAQHFMSRYLKTHEVVCRLGQPNIGMKLCHYFKSLAEQKHGNGLADEVLIRLPSHVVLGNLLSCQRESVTRELKKLSTAGILKQMKGSDYLLDIEKVDLYLGDLLD